jgi:hypothetical protein
MINTKLTRNIPHPPTTEERLFKLLESIDWKLWEMYSMMKDSSQEEAPAKKTTKKTDE